MFRATMIAVGIGKNTNGAATMDNGDLPKRTNACEARGDSKQRYGEGCSPLSYWLVDETLHSGDATAR